ncbi:MAG: ABC transporter substrate-binding protein [Hyphomicrobiales bacterium]
MRSTTRMITAAAGLAAVVAAPVGASADVQIGFLGGFTGPIESLTPPIFEAAQLAATHVNEQGGLLDGEQIEMPSADTGCVDSTMAVNGADRLINSDDVVAIVGALCSGATIAAANNVAVPAGVVMISPASTSPALTELDDNDLVFRTPPSDAYQGVVLARILRDEGVDSIAVTYVNNDYGKGLADAVEAAFEDAGGTVAVNEAHEDGKADYRPEIGSMAASGAETLVVLAYVDGSGQTIIRQAVEGGDFQSFAGGDGMVGDALIEAAGPGNLDGMILTRPGSPENPGSETYAQLATDAGLDPNATFGAQGYDAGFLLALAIEQAGSADSEGLSAALREVANEPGEVILPGEWEKAKQLIADGQDVNYEGATGTLEFDEHGDVPGVIEQLVIEGESINTVGLMQ